MIWHVSVHTGLIVKESSVLWSAEFHQQWIINFSEETSPFEAFQVLIDHWICLLRKLPLTSFFSLLTVERSQ